MVFEICQLDEVALAGSFGSYADTEVARADMGANGPSGLAPFLPCFPGIDLSPTIPRVDIAGTLGGIHTAQMGSVDLDARSTELGLTPGGTYGMDVFYADRHCCGSTFHIETTFQCITNIVIP